MLQYGIGYDLQRLVRSWRGSEGRDLAATQVTK